MNAKFRLLSVALVLLSGVLRAQSWQADLSLLQPFWLSSTMRGESLLFMNNGTDDAPRGSLLFPPTRILNIQSSSGEVTYLEGRDFLWKAGNREITLPHGSRIVHKTPDDLRRPTKSQAVALTHRDGRGEILFGAGHEYHDMQVVVTYEHAANEWKGSVPLFAGDRLPCTLAKLRVGGIRIALLGDSISTGRNASGHENVSPFQPGYHDLLAAGLRVAYQADVNLTNLSVSGMATGWGIENIAKVADAEPDLVILAFGMNDSSKLRAREYQANIRTMVEAVRKTRPEAEFILVAPMTGNTDWTALHHEVFPEYVKALQELSGTGIVVADMTSVWIEMLKHKKYMDLTGNGVNHPNDFGHRVYAQVLLALLVRDPMSLQ